MSHKASTLKEVTELGELFKAIICNSHSYTGCLALQSHCKGEVIVTSHSRELITRYTTNNALVKLIVSAIQNHLSQFKDGG